MPVTDADLQRLLVLEVGETPDTLLANNVVLLWARYADKAQAGPRLQELYTKRALIDIAIGSVREQVTFTIGGDFQTSLSHKAQALSAMRAATQAEIAAVESMLRANRQPVTAGITATEPIVPPIPVPQNPYPDSNDGRYAGSPYLKPGRAW